MGRPAGSGKSTALVRDYFAAHPESSITQAARDLGVSVQTVRRWDVRDTKSDGRLATPTKRCSDRCGRYATEFVTVEGKHLGFCAECFEIVKVLL